jgi:DNA invertase Pin-like site-specific DNA recombinase
MKKKAVIYARTSSSGAQESRQNTTRQVEDLQNYANNTNLDVLKVFEEHISGAKDNSERLILTECIEYCQKEHVDILLVNELSRLGRNAFHVLSTIQDFIRIGINVYMQKEQFALLDASGKPSIIAPVMIAVLATCAQMERENIQYRLNSGRALYIRNGGKLGRKIGYRKPQAVKQKEYEQVIRFLLKGHYTLKEIAKLTGKSVSTVQRVKKEFCTS